MTFFASAFFSSRRSVTSALVRSGHSNIVRSGGLNVARSAVGSVVSTPLATSASAFTTTTPHTTSMHATRLFSAISQDTELETALDELLGETMVEASNPTLEGELAKGHVEGSRGFPGGLVEVVSLFFVLI